MKLETCLLYRILGLYQVEDQLKFSAFNSKKTCLGQVVIIVLGQVLFNNDV